MDSCQIKTSADQYHMTHRGHVFFKYTADQVLVLLLDYDQVFKRAIN